MAGTNALELTGQRFGRLLVIERVGNSAKNHSQWRCGCECGVEVVAKGGALKAGIKQSCGCLAHENRVAIGRSRRRHGHARSGDRRPTITYSSWGAMLSRCENESHRHYAEYGGRGIHVCERWHDFDLFLQDIGERPSTRWSLDRFPDRDGNYEPGNVRWATQAEQIQNSASAKLTMGAVQEIHGRSEHGESPKSIAERMGMSRSHVTGIIRGAYWRSAKSGYPV